MFHICQYTILVLIFLIIIIFLQKQNDILSFKLIEYITLDTNIAKNVNYESGTNSQHSS